MINAFISFSSHSYKLYNIFPWLGLFLNSKRIIVRNVLKNRAQIVKLIAGLQETLNPHDRRGFVDSFLIRKQSEEEQVPCGIEIQEKAISKQLWCLNGIILVENFEWIIIKYFVTFFPPPYFSKHNIFVFCGFVLVSNWARRTHTFTRRILSWRWEISLSLVLTPQERHCAGVWCLWPNTLIYRVKTQ